MKTRAHQIHQLTSRMRPMAVRECRKFKEDYTYAVCPRCRVSMEREYVHYCNNCGQRLDWSRYENQRS